VKNALQSLCRKFELPALETKVDAYVLALYYQFGMSAMPNQPNDLRNGLQTTVGNRCPQGSTREDFRRTNSQRRFLAAFSATCNASRSARIAKIDRGQHYRWLRDDPTYPARFREAMQQATRTLEDHCVRLAFEGVKRMVTYKGQPVIYKGQIVYETEFDSQALMFLLKAYDRKRFGDKMENTFTQNWDGNIEDLPEEFLRQVLAKLDAQAVVSHKRIWLY
jgi:hypothetical protein